MEQWFAPVVPSVPPVAQSVLVLAPHPDDEIFGCGGLLALYGKSSAEIQVQVLTDGAGYHPQSQRESVFETRKQETNQALAALGLNHAVFSGYADRSLATRTDLAGVVQEIIQQQAADVVLAPSLWEIHPDHLATARAVLAAIHGLWRECEKVPTLLFYEIGAPQRVELLIDITEVWAAKHQAMQSFVSQNEVQNYARHIEALNAYRTYTLPPSVQYAEAYGVLYPQALGEYLSRGGSLNDRVIDRWVEGALAAATAHAETLQADLARVQQNDLDLRHEVWRLEEELSRAQAAVAAGRDEKQKLLAEQHSLLASNSWRVTAPLRRLAEFIRRKH